VEIKTPYPLVALNIYTICLCLLTKVKKGMLQCCCRFEHRFEWTF